MARRSAALASLSLAAAVYAQQVGTSQAETHPALTWQKCTAPGSCTNVSGSVVLDANWRWVHNTGGYTNCYTGNKWDATLCPDPDTCAKNCALDGADYSGTYGVTTSGSSLTLKFKTGSNVGSRVYLMKDENTYELFKPNNMEFTFDVDVSTLGCGLNGALYFSAMDADGGKSKYPNNKAGAKYGTGYCDAQCPHDLKFINGQANTQGWTGSSTNSGNGLWGSCCTEMDVWEANSISSAYTPHPCTQNGLYRCEGQGCSVCDQPGCDWAHYRLGDKEYYGPGKTIDTTKKMTVVTQFLTTTGTSTGTLKEIRRLYVQNGIVYKNSKATFSSLTQYDSITDEFCTAQKSLFGDTNTFKNNGGFTPMNTAFNNGVVLVMSIWDDYTANMLWLDSNYPIDKDPSLPGIARGTCATTSGVPADVESQQANAQVVFSNIKFGPIGSTYSGTTSSTTVGPTGSTTRITTTTTRATTTTTSNPAQQTHYGQCGGQGWTGPTSCVSPYTCQKLNDFYYQCL